jgi:hypothetical protein
MRDDGVRLEFRGGLVFIGVGGGFGAHGFFKVGIALSSPDARAYDVDTNHITISHHAF